MSSNLPVATGGGAVVSLPAGSVVPAADGGDLSIDRGGAPPKSGVTQFHNDLQAAVGVVLSVRQIERANTVMLRYRHAQDLHDRGVAEKAIKAGWGAATEGNLIKINGWLFDTLGEELAYEIKGARDGNGNGICNKPAVLEAMLKAAQAATKGHKHGQVTGAVAPYDNAVRGARIKEIHGWMGSPNGSENWKKYYSDEKVQAEYRDLVERNVNADGTAKSVSGSDGGSVREREIEAARGGADRLRELDSWISNRDPRYWKDEAVQREYRDLLERGVTVSATPKTADSGIEQRIKEIETLMGARPGSADFKRYWNDPQMQEEYRELQRRRQ